ncbi:Alpha/Beta hydrolase fold [Naviculisporaceae sp. PSN 640]
MKSILTTFYLVLSTLSCHISVLASPSTIDNGPFPADLNGSNFTYPWPVKLYRFKSQGLDLEMALMDIANPSSEPRSPAVNSGGARHGNRPSKNTDNRRNKTALLLHGRNFCSATWEETTRALLSPQGGHSRVIIPDQIGFCKSSKPGSKYQFTLHQLALNTKSLLDTLGIINLTIIGHSMGGMLATRFSLLYPSTVSNLVLVNPIGLEDYLSLGVPYPSIDSTLQTEQNTSYSSIRAYEQTTYYPNSPWTEAYDKWAVMLSSIYTGSKSDDFIQGQARVVDMVLTQPVVHELSLLQPKTLLMIGKKDNTAIGKQWSPLEVQEELGNYEVLGKEAARLIPHSTLIELEDLGHAPQVQDPGRFHAALTGWLDRQGK